MARWIIYGGTGGVFLNDVMINLYGDVSSCFHPLSILAAMLINERIIKGLQTV